MHFTKSLFYIEFNLRCIKYRGKKIYGSWFLNTKLFETSWKSDEVSKFSRGLVTFLTANVRFQWKAPLPNFYANRLVQFKDSFIKPFIIINEPPPLLGNINQFLVKRLFGRGQLWQKSQIEIGFPTNLLTS